MINKQRLIAAAAARGLAVEGIADALDQYATLLVDYNKKVNLTAITDPEGVEMKHFLDSLLLAAQPEAGQHILDACGAPGGQSPKRETHMADGGISQQTLDVTLRDGRE